VFSPDPAIRSRNDVLLALDVGNTSTGTALFKGGKLVRKVHFSSEPGIGQRIISQLVGVKPTAFYVSSVVPSLDSELRRLGKELKVPTVFIDHRTPGDLTLVVDHPEEVGADRIANAYGALDLYPPPLIIIDSGTATTFDLINGDGEYMGGVIFPGIEIALQSLADHTEKLDRVDFFKPASPVGQNTGDCIRSGLYYGYIGSLTHFISLYKEMLGPHTRVLVTGGLIDVLKGDLTGIDRYDQDLIFRGIYSIYHRASYPEGEPA
jgi:type III pantothenate kinase